jgi:hypothetical protein
LPAVLNADRLVKPVPYFKVQAMKGRVAGGKGIVSENTGDADVIPDLELSTAELWFRMVTG